MRIHLSPWTGATRVEYCYCFHAIARAGYRKQAKVAIHATR